ncbi:MAG: exoribonuclease family [Lasallia pustulata]|uniref:Ribosomal RNA-processing protein 43 n=1 Tax=Lasallia pustulata TaxID=136370 RepID=A0A5M8PY28_9LECA|nr:MAG: exoribonuclease family [Lasallia pustulata]
MAKMRVADRLVRWVPAAVAVVRVGDTAVVCGVRAEILLASSIPQPPPPSVTPAEEEAAEELAALGLLVPNLTLSTGCSPAHLPGSPPSPLAQSLTQRILTLLHTSRLVSLSDLMISHQPPADAADAEPPPAPEIKAYWTLYIDVLFISLDGNAFDAAWGAVLAALGDTRLPGACR